MENITNIWTSISPIQNEILALPFAILIIWLRAKLQPRVKIIWGQATNSFHLFPSEKDDSPKASIFMEKFYLQNTGRASAKEVELVFKAKPDHINVFPSRSYTEENVEEKYALKIPYIAPKDLVIIDTVSLNGNLCGLDTINCPDVITKKVRFIVQRQFPAHINMFFAVIFIAGLAYLISILLRIIGL